tara:strand:+ start:1230 stop:1865 length:636 start_codon:yes stop_codon:yes gene_type:complete
MNHESMQAYGLWGLVIINSAVFIFFALSFFKPKTRTDWRSFGAFSAFLVALFAEMYGFPLTIYLLSGWLQSRFPQVDWLSHDAGHLLEMMFGWEANPHFGPFHLLSFALIGGGFWLISKGWQELYTAQKAKNTGHTRAVCPDAAPPIPWLYPDHDRFFVPVANAADPRHVPRACLHVRAPGQKRREGCRNRIRATVATIRREHTPIYSQLA